MVHERRTSASMLTANVNELILEVNRVELYERLQLGIRESVLRSALGTGVCSVWCEKEIGRSH